MKKVLTAFIAMIMIAFSAAAFSVPASAQESSNIKEGLRLYYSKDFGEAAEKFKAALEEDRGNSLAIMYLTDCAKREKTVNQLLNEYEEKSLANPKDPYIKCYLGFFYFCKSLVERDDVFEESSNMFKEALKLDPNLALGYNGMGTVYYQKRLMPRARSYFAKAVKLDANDSMSLERLGDIYLNDDKNYGAAKGYFDEIISIYPSYPDAYFYAGSALQKSGENAAAIEMFKKAMERDPKGLTQGYYAPVRIGDIYYGDKNYKMAEEYYEDALKINPENSYALRMLDKAKNPDKEEKKPEEKKNPKVKDNIKQKIDSESK